MQLSLAVHPSSLLSTEWHSHPRAGNVWCAPYLDLNQCAHLNNACEAELYGRRTERPANSRSFKTSAMPLKRQQRHLLITHAGSFKTRIKMKSASPAKLIRLCPEDTGAWNAPLYVLHDCGEHGCRVQLHGHRRKKFWNSQH